MIRVGNQTTFVGKNENFVVKWVCHKQQYDVFYKGKSFDTKYSWKDVKTFLN